MAETGSVAMNTIPKANLQLLNDSSNQNSLKAVNPTALNIKAVKAAPTTPETIIFQLPTPVAIKINAPIKKLKLKFHQQNQELIQ